MEKSSGKLLDDPDFKSWFDLAIYSKTLDQEYWQAMIALRVQILQDNHVFGSANIRHHFDRLIAQTANFKHGTSGNSYIDLITGSHLPKAHPSAVLMTKSDFVDIAFYLSLPEINISNAWQLANKTPLTDLANYADTVDHPGYTPVMLNLNKPIQRITEDILQLQKKRNKKPKGSKSRSRLHSDLKVEFKKWAEYGLLPFFDLRFFSEITGKRISKRKLGELIWPPTEFPEIEDPEDRIKQYTEPFYEKVFTPETLAAIRFG
jgi:hypothetical protein